MIGEYYGKGILNEIFCNVEDVCVLSVICLWIGFCLINEFNFWLLFGFWLCLIEFCEWGNGWWFGLVWYVVF